MQRQLFEDDDAPDICVIRRGAGWPIPESAKAENAAAALSAEFGIASWTLCDVSHLIRSASSLSSSGPLEYA